MVTYSLRRAKPQVRLLAPHPIFVFFAILLLSGSSMAADPQVLSGDIDHHYAAAPDTLAVAAASSDSLARVVGGDIFGHYWSSFGGNGQITAIDGVSMRDRADGVQELATATYSTFKGVETAIANAAATDPLVLQWLEQIYDQLYTSSRSGDVVTKTSIADLLASFPSFGGDSLYNGLFYTGNGTYVYAPMNASVRSFLGLISRNLYFLLTSQNWAMLGSDGGYITTAQSYGLGYVMSSGLVGLAHLLLGDTSHPIYGLSYTGDDKESVRGSWSLADITANGMRGLATLLAGSDAHRKDGYVWLNQSGYEGNGSTSLMDMVGEGFLGLSSLFSDSVQGVPRLSWMYVSPDDGLTGTQLKHDTLFSFLGSFASGVQNPLARLAYVFADLDDIALKQQEKPNMDAVKDSFFGDGDGAVNPDQIKDAAGISSAAKDAFGGAGSPGDAFTAINDSQSFWFFSQEVADALDTVNAPALASEEEDDFMDQFVQDEDGFYSLIDLSPWDVGSYLGG